VLKKGSLRWKPYYQVLLGRLGGYFNRGQGEFETPEFLGEVKLIVATPRRVPGKLQV